MYKTSNNNCKYIAITNNWSRFIATLVVILLIVLSIPDTAQADSGTARYIDNKSNSITLEEENELNKYAIEIQQESTTKPLYLAIFDDTGSISFEEATDRLSDDFRANYNGNGILIAVSTITNDVLIKMGNADMDRFSEYEVKVLQNRYKKAVESGMDSVVALEKLYKSTFIRASISIDAGDTSQYIPSDDDDSGDDYYEDDKQAAGGGNNSNKGGGQGDLVTETEETLRMKEMANKTGFLLNVFAFIKKAIKVLIILAIIIALIIFIRNRMTSRNALNSYEDEAVMTEEGDIEIKTKRKD